MAKELSISSPRITNITPNIFFTALKSSGILQFYESDLQNIDKDERSRSFMEILQNAQYELYTGKFNQIDIGPQSIISLVGQEHDHPGDTVQALLHVAEAQQGGGLLILERNGDLHPKNPKLLLEASVDCEVVLENQLYSDLPPIIDPTTGIAVYPPSPLSIDERSWALGAYIANCILVRPGIAVTLIIGEYHIPEISRTIEHFLIMANYEGPSPIIKYIRSKSLPDEKTSPLTLTEYTNPFALVGKNIGTFEKVIKEYADEFNIDNIVLKNLLIVAVDTNTKVKGDLLKLSELAYELAENEFLRRQDVHAMVEGAISSGHFSAPTGGPPSSAPVGSGPVVNSEKDLLESGIAMRQSE